MTAPDPTVPGGPSPGRASPGLRSRPRDRRQHGRAGLACQQRPGRLGHRGHRARLGHRVPRRHRRQRRAARPSASDLDAGLRGLQWILDGYLVTLDRAAAPRRLAGRPLRPAAGVRDRPRRLHGRVGPLRPRSEHRRCSSPPGPCRASAARCSCPGSLAIISASFHPDDRGRAVGAWSGLAGVPSAIGPVPRRLAGRRGVVAAGLPHQRAPRRRGRRASRCATCPRRSDPDARAPTRRAGRGHRLGSASPALAYALIEGAATAGGAAVVAAVGGAARWSRLRRDRGPRAEPDAAARAVPLPPVHRGQPHDARRVRRARRRHVPGRAPAAGGARLLGPRGRRRRCCP